MHDPHCPDKQLLSSFAIGTLEEVTAEQLSQHVEHCPACTETLCGLDQVADTVMLQLRQATTEDPFADEVEYQQGLAAVAALGDIPSPPPIAPEMPLTDLTESLPQLREYLLLKKLGQGGMGTVYQAVHTRLGKMVAIKVLSHGPLSNPAVIDRFSREMLAIGRLDHPHLIRAHDAGEFEQQHYLVMEYIDGVDLSVLARTVKSLPIADACEIIRQAALGLEYAHQSGLVHRDIKPSNLMLTTLGQVKVLDLGLALLSHGDEPQQELTLTGHIMGTIDYMAPEQGGDTHRVDIRADIYSLGATLYKLLTGDVPFADSRNTTVMQKLTLLATQEPPPIQSRRPEISDGLAAVIQRMLVRNPALRFPTPAEVAAALLPFTTGANLKALSLRARPDTVSPQATPDTSSELTELSPEIVTSQFAAPMDVKPSPLVRTQNSRAWTSNLSRSIAAFAGAALIVAGIVFFWETPEGMVRFEINDPEIKIAFDNDRPTITQADKKVIELGVGAHTLKVKRGDLEFKTKEFELKGKGDQVSLKIDLLPGKVQVTLGDKVLGERPLPGKSPGGPPGQPANVAGASANVDRRAAEYVLSIGGTVGFIENGKERRITAVADLPREPFELTVVGLNWDPKVTDAGLANCQGCRNVTVLDLDGTQISDAGMMNFKDCKHLTHLGLHGTKVSDTGLAPFKGSTELTHLDVGVTSVSDAGLANFKDCKHLTVLDATCNQITDAGLAYFKDCNNLTTLRVGGPLVTDAGLAWFKDCQDLTELNLSGPQISDAGLAHFKDCKKIKGLYLNCGRMTEAGLSLFKDRKLGGLNLIGSEANDAWLAHFPSWNTTLGQVLLGETRVGDVGLAHLKDGDIYILQLVGTQVSDAGLVHLQGHKHLGALDLTRTGVSDAGLEHLASIQSLGALELRGTKVTADGVRKVQAALPKCRIVSDFLSPVPVVAAVALDKPFVLIRAGKRVREFKSGAGALAELQAGDEIEVHGNGPFALPQIHLDGKGLVLRAAPGFRPRFVPSTAAAEQATTHSVTWIYVNNGDVTLDGCDFDFIADAGHMAVGVGGTWRITRCRLYQPDAKHTQGLLSYAGPKLHIRDSVLICGFSYGSIFVGESAEVEFENNIFWSRAFHAFHLGSAKGPKVHLAGNTFTGIGSAFSLPSDTTELRIRCENNIFSSTRGSSFVRSPRNDVDAVALRSQLKWEGSHNLYDLGSEHNPTARFLDHSKGDSVAVIVGGKVPDWQEYWGEHEQHALSASGPTLLYQSAWLPDSADDTLPRLRHWINRPLRSAGGVTESKNEPAEAVQPLVAGPDWKVVGPGQGYLQALAAVGQAVPENLLLPEASDEGPITLFRDEKPSGSYPSLREALVNAVDGDVVAIHSSGVISGIDRSNETQRKRITLRAGYGHRPRMTGLTLAAGEVWSIEGIHFTADVNVHIAKPAAGERPSKDGPRLVNCSFDPEPDWQRNAGASLRVMADSDEGPVCEVVNCVLPNYLGCGARRLKISNSALCGVDHGNSAAPWGRHFDLKRCAVYTGSSFSIGAGVVAMSMTANQCWFEFGYICHGAENASFEWQGDHNVFCHGPAVWVSGIKQKSPLGDLNTWRARWKSDAHSRSGDAVYVDPAFYGVLPESPAHKASEGGTDLGADLTRFVAPAR